MMLKRLFDVFFAFILLLVASPLLLFVFLVSTWDTHSCGLFVQPRLGRYAQPFRIYKIKTVHDRTRHISPWGRFLRRSKLDELPQLFNILRGDMSFVGPRPDLPGYADHLPPEDRFFLRLRPGLTGLASLHFRREETLLAAQPDPSTYNDTVLWPAKVRLNTWYAHHRSFALDLSLLAYTFLPFLPFPTEEWMKKWERGGSS